jgi:pyruvate formate lyase activating enzyme
VIYVYTETEKKRILNNMKLNIHSIESFSTLDGPGIRYVLFLQGCSFRCQYCHNPDTWDKRPKNELAVDNILWEIKKSLPYLQPNRGGVTASGGEPLEQAACLTELFTKARQLGITTCVDTAGYLLTDDVKKLLCATDFVLLDLKHALPDAHRRLTGQDNKPVFLFQDYLDANGITYWIRYPLLEGLNDDAAALSAAQGRLSGRPYLEKVEVLPYHTLGVFKWQELGRPYTLADRPAVSQARANEVQQFLTANKV